MSLSKLLTVYTILFTLFNGKRRGRVSGRKKNVMMNEFS